MKKSLIIGALVVAVIAVLCFVFLPTEGMQLSKANKLSLENNYEEAFKIYKELAEKGNAEATYRLAEAYCAGRGVEQSDSLACKYYKLSSELGFEDAIEDKARVFKTNFEMAIEHDSLDKAETIANASIAYSEGLSESKRQIFNGIVPSYVAILMAKKYNKKYLELIVGYADFVDEKNISKCIDLMNESKAFYKTLNKKDAKVFNETILNFEEKIIKSKGCNLAWKWCMAIDGENLMLAKRLAKEMNDTIATLSTKNQEAYKSGKELAKQQYLGLYENAVYTGDMPQTTYNYVKKKILSE